MLKEHPMWKRTEGIAVNGYPGIDASIAMYFIILQIGCTSISDHYNYRTR